MWTGTVTRRGLAQLPPPAAEGALVARGGLSGSGSGFDLLRQLLNALRAAQKGRQSGGAERSPGWRPGVCPTREPGQQRGPVPSGCFSSSLRIGGCEVFIEILIFLFWRIFSVDRYRIYVMCEHTGAASLFHSRCFQVL